METLTFKASPELLQHLEIVAEKQERSKGFLVRKAVEFYLAELEQDEEDARIAMQRLRADNPKERVSLEALEKRHGLAN